MNSQTEYRSQLHHRQKELMVKWYERLNEAAETGNPPTVSMMVSGNCVELLEGFGAVPIRRRTDLSRSKCAAACDSASIA
jgi:hypothetical protein